MKMDNIVESTISLWRVLSFLIGTSFLIFLHLQLKKYHYLPFKLLLQFLFPFQFYLGSLSIMRRVPPGPFRRGRVGPLRRARR